MATEFEADLAVNADCVEALPAYSDFPFAFTFGCYQLEEGGGGRRGKIGLYTSDAPPVAGVPFAPTLVQEVDMPGVLDFKW